MTITFLLPLHDKLAYAHLAITLGLDPDSKILPVHLFVTLKIPPFGLWNMPYIIKLVTGFAYAWPKILDSNLFTLFFSFATFQLTFGSVMPKVLAKHLFIVVKTSSYDRPYLLNGKPRMFWNITLNVALPGGV